MALFVGEFDVAVDAKHRLAIPAALRDLMDPQQDGTDFYLVVGFDRHLWLYPDKFYRRLLEPTQKSPLPTRNSQRLNLMFAMARVVKPDGQGRVVLPEKSMQRAVFNETTTLVGNGDHIELWPTEDWNKHVEETLPHYGQDVLDAGDGMQASQ